MDAIHKVACDRLEAELQREDGSAMILVVGDRRCGKTTVCETVLRRLGRHVVLWTPYGDFVAGDVAAAYTGLQTVVFVDDADVLVRLTKGSSVTLMQAVESCRLRPGVRIIMTALDTKGRVWRSVASRAGAVHVIPNAVGPESHSHPEQSVRRQSTSRQQGSAWETVLETSARAVSSRMMHEWCNVMDAEEAFSYTGVGTDADTGTGTDDKGMGTDTDTDTDGCVVRKVAQILGCSR